MSAQPETMTRAPRGLRVLEGESAELPHSLEAEEHLLSCCLIDGGAAVARCLAARLTPASFYSPANRICFEKLAALQRSGRPVDTVVLAEELKISGQLEVVGGFAFIAQVSQRVPTTAQLGYFIDRVRELWLLRESMLRARGIIETCRDYKGGGITAAIGQGVLKLQRLLDFETQAKRTQLSDRIEARRLAAQAEAAGRVDKSRWLTFGMPWCDACLLPFDVRQEDWQVIVGGPPSGGKSAFMRHLALHNADQGKRGIVFLLETGLRWVDQAAAMRARVNLREPKCEWPHDRLAAFDQRLVELRDYAAEQRLTIVEDIAFVEDIERTIREVNRTLLEREIAQGVPTEQARGLDFAVVDYLQIVQTRENFRGSREQAVSHVSMKLKQLFKGLDITGFVGAQINRGSREDPSKPPGLASLRESGSIEQDADRVLFVHTPPTNRAGITQDGTNLVDEVEIIQRKSRNGPRDVSCAVLFHKTQTRYEEAVRKGEARPGMPKPAEGYKREGRI